MDLKVVHFINESEQYLLSIADRYESSMSDVFVEDLDVTPDKKILQAISSDIDLKKGVLELVDNAIDEWRLRKTPSLIVELTIDVGNKSLLYSDNAGGIQEKNLNMVIQPGGTTRTPEQKTIGEFGIGLKRAIVALSIEAEVISRFESQSTFKIIVDDSWVKSKSWKIRKYKSKPISSASTIVNFKHIKCDLNLEALAEMQELLSETYSLQLSDLFSIILNGESLQPSIFNNWAFPPEGRHPRTYKTFIRISGRKVFVDLTVGLMRKSSQTGDYGFDIFCNDRLILKNYKDPEIGFVPGLLGYPHPSSAWFRGIAQINGANSDMPWNSTKSGLDFSNPIISPLKAKLLKLSKPYVQLSRRLYRDSQQQITPFSSGKIETVNFLDREEISLTEDDTPKLPPGKKSDAEVLLNQNKKTIRKYPWTRALVENVYIVDLIMKKIKLENKNRFALLLLDTCLEVAFKDYLFRVLHIAPDKASRLNFTNRNTLLSAIKDKTKSKLPDDIWVSVDFFYELRCSLYHEMAAIEVTDSDIDRFREVVAQILYELHEIVV